MSANFGENIILFLTVCFLLLEDMTIVSRNVSFELCEVFRNIVLA
jgi:hypothetical protein